MTHYTCSLGAIQSAGIRLSRSLVNPHGVSSHCSSECQQFYGIADIHETSALSLQKKVFQSMSTDMGII